jgi:hypothetical protein
MVRVHSCPSLFILPPSDADRLPATDGSIKAVLVPAGFFLVNTDKVQETVPHGYSLVFILA